MCVADARDSGVGGGVQGDRHGEAAFLAVVSEVSTAATQNPALARERSFRAYRREASRSSQKIDDGRRIGAARLDVSAHEQGGIGGSARARTRVRGGPSRVRAEAEAELIVLEVELGAVVTPAADVAAA